MINLLWLKLAFAGLGPMVFHWGIGVGAIILLVVAAEFSTMIPIIGPWFEKVRKDLLWVAVAIALVLVGEWIGARDAAARCEAKAAVVTSEVHRAVTRATRPTIKGAISDPWGNEP